MKRIHRVALSTLGGLILATLLPFLSAQYQRANTLSPTWKPLFNGFDLTGWQRVGNEKWLVKDKVIYGEGITEEYGYLATRQTYTNFHLSLRFRCDAKGNSGVYIHTKFAGDTPKIIAGRQIEIDPKIGNHTGGLYSSTKGWLAWPSPAVETTLHPYEWNQLVILVEGNRYRSYLNGVEMIDFTYPSPNSTTGVIALQLHSGGEGKMRFKDIYIRDLGPSQQALR